MGSTRMALLSTLTMTMMYCMPLCDVMPKRPVWSVWMAFLSSTTLMKTSRSFRPRRSVVSISARGAAFGLVERMFCRCRCMCPAAVSSFSGKYLRMYFSSAKGKPTRLRARQALIHVAAAGYPMHACIQCTACSIEGRSYTLCRPPIRWRRH